jgi:hypothetical protein
VTLAEQLLREGVPPSLLIDLLDPEGLRVALASELLASDVAADVAADVGAVRQERVEQLRTA